MESMRVGGPSSQTICNEYFQPSFYWGQNSNAHLLLIELPGFKKEDLKLKVESVGKITVSGEKRVSENKCSLFKQVFDVPCSSIIEKISGKFEPGLLSVIIPKKEVEKKEEKNVNLENVELFDRVLDQIIKNKAIIATAVLAFSFGMYISRRLR